MQCHSTGLFAAVAATTGADVDTYTIAQLSYAAVTATAAAASATVAAAAAAGTADVPVWRDSLIWVGVLYRCDRGCGCGQGVFYCFFLSLGNASLLLLSNKPTLVAYGMFASVCYDWVSGCG